MYKLAGVICSLLLSNVSFGQSTFFEFVTGWSNNYSFEEDNSYKLIGLSDFEPFVLGDHFIQFVEMNTLGQTISEQEFSIDTTDFLSRDLNSQSVLNYGDYIYIASQTGFLSSNTVYGCLLRYNKVNLEMELIKVFHDEISNYLFTLALKNDSSLLIGGYQSNNAGTTSLFLHETDLQGAPRWTYTTECGNSCYNYAEHILPLENGNTVLLYREWDYEIGNQDKERAVLVMIDTAGVELWRVYPGNDEDYKILPGGVVLQDDQLLVCFTDPYVYETNGDWVAYFENSVYFEKYNFSGAMINSFDLVGQIPDGSAPELPILFYDITQTQILDDGNILLSGYTGIHGNLIKMTPSGELIWYREYTPYPLQPDNPNFTQYTRILHTLPTSDGGFLCTGTYRSDPRDEYPNGIQTAIALKVDEFGCLEEGCELVGLGEQGIDESQFNIFPNPAETTLNISSAEETIISEWQVMDLSGKIIAQESALKAQAFNIDVTEMDQGLYLIQVTDSDGNTAVKKFVKR